MRVFTNFIEGIFTWVCNTIKQTLNKGGYIQVTFIALVKAAVE